MTIKVKLLKGIDFQGKKFKKGDVLTVKYANGVNWIEAKVAVEYKGKK